MKTFQEFVAEKYVNIPAIAIDFTQAKKEYKLYKKEQNEN